MLTLLHTADVHITRFDAIRDALAPDQSLTHIVRPEWLARAQGGIDAALADEITQEITAAAGQVLCTCTTLGETAGAAGAIRIDAPMMQDAANRGGTILLVLCLDSTRDASLALLNRAIAVAGTGAAVQTLILHDAWAAFVAGDMAAYAEQIAAGITGALASRPEISTVLLGQASMDVAAPLLAGIAPTVLTPARSAFAAAIGRPA